MKKGDRHSAETIAKMRLGRKSAETRAKMSAAKLGRKFTDEHRANISAAKLGKKPTEVHIANRAAAFRENAEARRLAAKVDV